jgi:hypothetical protein
MAAAGDPDIVERYSRVRRAIEHSAPSLLVVIANDHLNAYFMDRLPAFSISLGDQLWGPIDQVPGIPTKPLLPDPVAAAHLAQALVSDGFDLMQSRETPVDHSVIVPLHFLNYCNLPVIVLNVNGYVAPLPSARRCHNLGVALARAIKILPGDCRVAVIASGVFSQEVGGPRVDEGKSWSVPRPDWVSRVAQAFAAGDVETVLTEATPSLLVSAGSVAGELLSWVTMVGAVGPFGAGLQPMIDHRPGEAFAFGIWTEKAAQQLPLTR